MRKTMGYAEQVENSAAGDSAFMRDLVLRLEHLESKHHSEGTDDSLARHVEKARYGDFRSNHSVADVEFAIAKVVTEMESANQVETEQARQLALLDERSRILKGSK